MVFALLAVQELGTRADPAVAAIVTTVLLSVVAHGVTAEPFAARFAARYRSGAAAAAPTPSGTGDAPHGP